MQGVKYILNNITDFISHGDNPDSKNRNFSERYLDVMAKLQGLRLSSKLYFYIFIAL